ncbi:RICIN domain-containing protein [Sorangium sp. So ce854]|uniref:RICIN domain-containing protein n=1 Tax=Sorangium sp. So ce854 TaxID=3133322 RepID=UPI003F629D30
MRAGIYFIVTSFAGRGFCIDMPSEHAEDYDADIQKFNPTGGYTQKWDFIADPDRPGRFLIKWHYAEKYLEPDDNSNDNGAKIRFNRRNNNNAYQSWRVESAGGDRYFIVNDGSGKCIDYWSDEDRAGGKVRQKDRADVDQQKWFLQATAP